MEKGLSLPRTPTFPETFWAAVAAAIVDLRAKVGLGGGGRTEFMRRQQASWCGLIGGGWLVGGDCLAGMGWFAGLIDIIYEIQDNTSHLIVRRQPACGGESHS